MKSFLDARRGSPRYSSGPSLSKIGADAAEISSTRFLHPREPEVAELQLPARRVQQIRHLDVPVAHVGVVAVAHRQQ